MNNQEKIEVFLNGHLRSVLPEHIPAIADDVDGPQRQYLLSEYRLWKARQLSVIPGDMEGCDDSGYYFS